MHLLQGALVSPTNALNYYGSPASPAAAARDVSVMSAARGLEYDPDRIYRFVRNYFAYEPVFGLHKGSAGVLADRSGDAFDLANLLVDLLREAGISSRYVLGTVNLGPEAQAIFRTSSALQTCQLLANGGAPAVVNGSTNCATQSGAVSSVSMLHVWVEANVNGQWLVMDPSLKQNTPVSGIDLWGASGTSAASAWSAMSSGTSTTGNQLSFSWSAVTGAANTASQTLFTALRTTYAQKTLDQIQGGWSTTPDVAALSTAQPSYVASVSTRWTGDIPAAFRATLRVQAAGFDQTLDLPTFYGQRLQAQIAWYYQNGTAVANPSFQLFARRCQGLAGTNRTSCEAISHWQGAATPIATWTSSPTVQLSINHPWAANSGTFGDQTVTRVLEGGKRAEIVVRVGGSDSTRYETHRGAADRFLMRNYVQTVQTCNPTCSHSQDPNYYEYSGDGSPPDIAAAARQYVSLGESGASEIASNKDHVANLWWGLMTQVSRTLETVGSARLSHQHTLGIVISPLYGENALDLDTSVGVASAGSYQPHQILTALASLSGEMEGAAIKELAVERLWATNSLGQNAGGPSTVGVTSGVSAALQANMSGGAATVLSPGQSATGLTSDTNFNNQVQLYLTNGFSVVVPNQSQPGGFYARRSDGSEASWVVAQAAAASGTAWGTNAAAYRKGAIGSTAPNPAGMAPAAAAAFPAGKFGNADVGDAAAVFSEKSDASAGDGGFPYQLTFARSYRSSGFAATGGLGPGWTHSFASGGHFTLCHLCYVNGAFTPASANLLVATLFALDAAGQDTLSSNVLAGAVAHWWSTVSGSAVDLSVAAGTERFLKPTSSSGWVSGGASGNTLAITNEPASLPFYNEAVAYSAAPTFIRTLKDGSTQLFAPLQVMKSDGSLQPSDEYALKTWTFSQGVHVVYTYTVSTAGNIETLRKVETLANYDGSSLGYISLNHTEVACSQDNQYALCAQTYATRATLANVQVPAISSGTYQVSFAYAQPSGCAGFQSYCLSTLVSATPSSGPTVQRNYTYVDTASQASGPEANWTLRATDFVLLATAANQGDTLTPIQFAYEEAGGLVKPKVMTASSFGHAYTYFSSGAYFASVQDPVGGVQRVSFDAFKRPFSYADEVGRTTYTGYDGLGRVVSTIKPWGDRFDYQYDANSNLTQSTHSPNGAADPWWGQTIVVKATYDASNNLTSVVKPATTDDPNERSWTLTWNSNHQVTQVTAPQIFDGTCNCYNSPTWTYRYYDYGLPLSSKNALGAVADYTYDSSGTCATEIATEVVVSGSFFICDPSSHKNVGYYRDGSSGAVRLDKSADGTVNHVYGDGLPAEQNFTYDNDGRLTKTSTGDKVQNSTNWYDATNTYASDGRLTSTTDIQGRTARYCYDALGRTTVKAGPSGRATKYLYNAAGDLTSIEGWWTVTGTDACTLTSTLPAGQASHTLRSFVYNSGGMLYQDIDANGNAITYTYEELGRRIAVSYPDPDGTGPQTATVEYDLRDQRDQLVLHLRRASVSQATTGGTRYFYDNTGNVLYGWESDDMTNYPVGRQNAFSYNQAGDKVWSGYYQTAPGGSQTLIAQRSLAHDRVSRLTQECVTPDVQYSSSFTRCFDYNWTWGGNRTQITWHVSGITGSQPYYFAQYARNGDVQPTEVSFQYWPADGSGLSTYYGDRKYVRGLFDRAVGYNQNQDGSAYAYGHGQYLFTQADILTLGGDLTSRNVTVTSDGPTAPATTQPEAFAYGFDGDGKLTSQSPSPSALEWQPPSGYARSYGPANPLNQVASEAGAAIAFDTEGNMTSDGQTAYTYDHYHRLLTASHSGMSASYMYDEDGRRTKKVVNGVATWTFWSSFGEELLRTTGTDWASGTISVPSGGGVDDRFMSLALSNTAATFYYTDRLGSVVATSAVTTGTLSNLTAYSLYGELPAGQVPPGGVFGYAGREFDAETGLYYNRARYYSPRLGQFTQADPVGTAGGSNLYGYAGGDPLNHTDPRGTDAWIISRPVYSNGKPGGFVVGYHEFIVVGKSINSPDYQFSWGPDVNGRGVDCVVGNNCHLVPETGRVDPATNTLNATSIDDTMAISRYGHDDLVSAQKLSDPDDVVIKRAMQVNNMLNSQQVPYMVYPINQGNYNSDSAAHAAAFGGNQLASFAYSVAQWWAAQVTIGGAPGSLQGIDLFALSSLYDDGFFWGPNITDVGGKTYYVEYGPLSWFKADGG